MKEEGRASSEPIRHSVLLDSDSCRGCTNCIKRCPVEAIRVRKGKAYIITERCIDCGECIRVCPYKAKKADSDPISRTGDFDHAIALPAPAFFAQFESRFSSRSIMDALLSIGFDDAVEVAEAAALVADETARLLAEAGRPRPLISASCPAVVRLIQVRYPSLLENVAGVLSPMETAARLAKARAREAGVRGKIGAFFISPCPAKVTAARLPLGHEKSEVDAVIAFKDIHAAMLSALSAGALAGGAGAAGLAGEGGVAGAMGTAGAAPLIADAAGLAWGRAEGESEKHRSCKSIAVDGIDRVIGLLEEIENGALTRTDFVEALACPGGCVGGPLAVVNPSVSRARLRSREQERRGISLAQPPASGSAGMDLSLTDELDSRPALRLHADFSTASSMLEEMEEIAATLPGLDCGSCGAPSCRALAEDIVRGIATANDCIFILRERLRSLTRELIELESLEPPSLDHGDSD